MDATPSEHAADAGVSVVGFLAGESGASVASAILDLARRLFQADAYAIWRLHPEKGTWSSIADLGLSESYPRTLPPEVVPAMGVVLHTEDVYAEPLLEMRREGYTAEGIRSLFSVPLRVAREPAATITFYYRQPHRFSEAEVAAVTALANLAGSALTTAALHQEQQRLRIEAERAQRRAAFLAEASRVLASSLDYETTLEHVAQSVVPHLADWFTVHLREEDGTIRQVAVTHADPEKVKWARSLEARYPPDPEAPQGLYQVLRTGKAELYPEVTDEMLVHAARDPEHLEILRQVGFTSVLIAPLCARDQVLGAITFISAESRTRYDASEVELAEDLARRAATAIDNARLYRQAQGAVVALTASEAQFRRLVEANIISIVFEDADGTLFEANDAFLQMVGYAREELRGGRLRWDALTVPEHGSLDGRTTQEVLDTGVCAPYEMELLRKDGSRVPVLVGRARLEAPAQGHVAFLLDLTDRKQLEEQGERLAAIVASSDDAIISKDLNGIVQSWNDAATRIFGYTAAEMIGQPIARLLPPERASEEAGILARLRRGERLDHIETVRVRKDGQRIDVSVTISPVFDAAGRIVGASNIGRDITSRKALQEELRQRTEDLAEEARRKDEYLMMLAHELRNPLGAVSNALHVLQVSKPNTPSFDRALDAAFRQVEHQARLVEDLLDVSRMIRDTLDLRPERLDLGRLVREATEDYRSRMERAGLSLALQVPDEALPVLGDRTRLTQVLGNLLDNAVRFTPHGGRIGVRIVTDEARREVAVAVQDTGEGIEPEVLPRLFDPLTQADRSLDRSRGGLGLGLALVKGLVERHGGRVSAHSEGPGRGAEFIFWLPIQGEVPTVQEIPLPRTQVNKPLRVLIVEDNRDGAETLRDLLEVFGYDVRLAYTGLDGLNTARQFHPQVVLCDIGLPGMDGYQVASELRRDPTTAPAHLIAVTGYGGAEERRRSKAAGFEEHLTKPVDPEQLQRLLSAAGEG